MPPIIHVKFRKRAGVHYAVEQFVGNQFRCRHCNKVFYSQDEIDYHIDHIVETGDKTRTQISPDSPKLDYNLTINIFYGYDAMDKLRKRWLKSKNGEEYDGI
ncbi:MAG TPA: hypothetical protein VHO03_20275 [Ignavibacteriales bacterium]|nr:hypothetical protein [Ignavibacteriales bacterium]